MTNNEYNAQIVKLIQTIQETIKGYEGVIDDYRSLMHSLEAQIATLRNAMQPEVTQ